MPELLLASDDDMGGGDPIRTWFLRYIGSIGDLIPKAKHAMVEKKTSKSRYEEVKIAKMNAEANDIDLAALMKAWDFRIRSVKLYRLDKAGGVDLNRTINMLPTPVDQQDRHFTSPQYSPPSQCHHYQNTTGAKASFRSRRQRSHLAGRRAASRVSRSPLFRLQRALFMVRAAEQRP